MGKLGETMIYGRDSKGRFISKQSAIAQKALVERTKPSAKIVVFRERIRGTRVARIMKRAYPVDEPDDVIGVKLAQQYDTGGNYVIGITSIGVGYMKPGDEIEIERGKFGSADIS